MAKTDGGWQWLRFAGLNPLLTGGQVLDTLSTYGGAYGTDKKNNDSFFRIIT